MVKAQYSVCIDVLCGNAKCRKSLVIRNKRQKRERITGHLTGFELHGATASFSVALNWQTPTSCKLCILEI